MFAPLIKKPRRNRCFSGLWLVLAGVLMLGLAPQYRLLASTATDDSEVNAAAEISPIIDITGVAEVADDAQAITDPPTPATPPESHPLSVEPTSQLLPKDRPSWISLEPDLESPTHRLVVQSIPTSLKSEVEGNLDAPLQESLQDYLDRILGDDQAGKILRDRIDASFIRRNLLDEAKSYDAELQTTIGPVYQKWVMVEISPKQREQFQLWYNQHQQRQRLAPLGLVLAGLISLVGISHLALRRRCGRLEEPAPQPVSRQDFGHPPQFKTPQAKRRCKGNLAAILAIGIAVIVVMSTSTPKSSKKSKKTDRNDRAALISESTDQSKPFSNE